MIYQASPEERAQVQAALPEIQDALATCQAANPMAMDAFVHRELLPLLSRHGRLLHTLIMAELAAVLETAEAALHPLIANDFKRRQMIGELDVPLSFSGFRNGLGISHDSAPGLLRLAAKVFGEVAGG